MFFSIIVGGTYKFDLRTLGIDIHNHDIKGTLITILIMIVVMFHLHAMVVQETFIQDGN